MVNLKSGNQLCLRGPGLTGKEWLGMPLSWTSGNFKGEYANSWTSYYFKGIFFSCDHVSVQCKWFQQCLKQWSWRRTALCGWIYPILQFFWCYWVNKFSITTDTIKVQYSDGGFKRFKKDVFFNSIQVIIVTVNSTRCVFQTPSF